MTNTDSVPRIRDRAKAFFSGNTGSHDWSHVERVYNLCMHIGNTEQAGLEVLKLAAWLHDIGREEEVESKGEICHAQRGAQLASEILTDNGFEKDIIDNVTHCIRTHRFRDETVPETIEAKVLFDADKLDSIGAVGIGRAFLFAGEMGAYLHNGSIDPYSIRPYSKEDTAYREYLVKLRLVKDRILTREGKRLAESRHSFMEKFFERIDKETRGEM